MTNALLNVSTVTTTMSSLEIAELTGKEHKNILADIRMMLANLTADFSAARFEGTYKSRGKEYQCFNLDKEHTLCLVSGYSVQMRMAIIKRWQELENKQVPVVSVPQTYAAELLEAGRLAMEVEEKNAQLALAAPKVEFVEKYVESKGNLGFRQTAKVLNILEPVLREFLLNNNIMYQLGWRSMRPSA